MINKEVIPSDVFFDEVHDETYRQKWTKNIVHFVNEKWKIYAHYKNKKHEIIIQDLKLKPVEAVEAKYMIEPILN
jgi:hypothetical protein